MKLEYIDKTDIYWSAKAHLNTAEWPPVADAWEDDWMHRPIWRWVRENAPDSCFTCRGMVFFRDRRVAEWFRITWEQAP